MRSSKIEAKIQRAATANPEKFSILLVELFENIREIADADREAVDMIIDEFYEEFE